MEENSNLHPTHKLDTEHDLRLSQIYAHYGTNAGYAEPLKFKVPENSKKTFKQKIISGIPLVLIILGLSVFGYKVAAPVVLSEFDDNSRDIIIKPIENDDDVSVIKNPNLNFRFDELLNTTQVKPPEEGVKFENLPEYFYISVPKLKIDKAKIKTNSLDMNPKYALGHYRGSCLPGDACNTFVFGHSTFKSLPNRYDKGDYSAVFSRLNELKFGDEFTIYYNDKEFKYIVNTMKIESPSEVDPLTPPFGKGSNVSSATLFTCDPPGTTKNRLLVVGILAN